MRTNVTAKIKIATTPEIVKTIKVYTKGLQLCVNQAWNRKIKNNIKLHPFVYKYLRKNLPSQLAISCIKQACGIVKKAKTKPIIKKANVRFNFPRNASLKKDRLILRLLKKRQEFDLNIPSCYKSYFDWKICESLLRMDKQGRTFFLFTFSKEVDTIEQNIRSQNIVLGIDLGVNNLAVTSEGKFFNSGVVKQAKRRFKYLRSKLQAKGTRSAKRLLKKISGRETRFMAWINHNISKNIVSEFTGNKIIMENLKGIRKQKRGKTMNYWISNWSFSQLQSFITYKAEREGIVVEKVKPNYTSQLCSRCGKLGSRSKNSFVCHCGFSLNADLNASRNLAHPMLGERQALVTVPYSRSVEAEGASQCSIEAELTAKNPAI